MYQNSNIGHGFLKYNNSNKDYSLCHIYIVFSSWILNLVIFKQMYKSLEYLYTFHICLHWIHNGRYK